jgi:hypothetical protein
MTRRPWPARRALGRGRGIAVCASSRRRACSLQTERAARRGEARYCRDRRDLSLGLFLSRLYDSFADLLRRRGVVPLPASPGPGAPTAGGEPAFRPGRGS